MAKLYLEELQAAMSSDIFSRLETDKQEATAVKDKITSFVSSSKETLTGKIYDGYRTQFDTFCTTMNQRISLADKLSTSIKEALQLLIDYMEGDLYLDTSRLNEYYNSKSACESSIERLKQMLNSPNVSNASDISNQIALAEQTLAEINRIIKKLEGLDAVYGQAESILNSAFSEISPFGSSVSSIKPNGIYSYHLT